MKKIIYLTIATTLIFSSCKKKSVTTSSETKETKDVVVASIEKVNLIQFSKSACYGKCPTYNVTITQEGLVDYNARANMPLLGEHKLDMGSAFPAKILAKANDLNYFKLNDKYDNQYVTDIPSTTLNLETSKRKKTTYARYEVPNELIELNNFIHNEILEFTSKMANLTKKPVKIEGVKTGELKQRPEKRILH